MREYELVREIPNLCRNNQMRDVFFDEVETDDPVQYVRTFLKGKALEISVDEKGNGAVTVYAVCDGLYRIEFGSSEDISLTLEVAYAIIESGKLDSTMVSVIDVSDPSEGAVISDKTQVLIPDDK